MSPLFEHMEKTTNKKDISFFGNKRIESENISISIFFNFVTFLVKNVIPPLPRVGLVVIVSTIEKDSTSYIPTPLSFFSSPKKNTNNLVSCAILLWYSLQIKHNKKFKK